MARTESIREGYESFGSGKCVDENEAENFEIEKLKGTLIADFGTFM